MPEAMFGPARKQMHASALAGAVLIGCGSVKGVMIALRNAGRAVISFVLQQLTQGCFVFLGFFLLAIRDYSQSRRCPNPLARHCLYRLYSAKSFPLSLGHFAHLAIACDH